MKKKSAQKRDLVYNLENTCHVEFLGEKYIEGRVSDNFVV
jgi:hypothetical protein